MNTSNLKYQALPLQIFLQEVKIYTFDPFLFLQAEHLILQRGEQVWVLFAENKQGIEAMISLFLEGDKAYSPLRMSFGGIIATETTRYTDIDTFVQFVLSFCKKHNIKELQITSYPFSYAPNLSAICSQIFLQNGFCITNAELTHYLTLTKNFEENLHLSALRRLKKCQRSNFTFELWENADLHFVYEFVASNRQRKNYPISMPFEDFQKTILAFPNKYLVFVLKSKQEIIALTVAIIINQKILYNFYPADKKEYLSYSPMIMLMAGLYEFAKEKGFQILDLGISSEQSKPNYGLIRFKENLACQSSLKLSFRKYL